jgi:hypothetical protein
MIIGNFALRLIALLASVAASARSQTDQITGTVTYGSTAAVPNTMVTATDTETGKYVALESALGDSEMMTLNVQFRAQFFKAANRAKFGEAGMQFGTSTFGIVSSQANNPGQIQLALKAMF